MQPGYKLLSAINFQCRKRHLWVLTNSNHAYILLFQGRYVSFRVNRGNPSPDSIIMQHGSSHLDKKRYMYILHTWVLTCVFRQAFLPSLSLTRESTVCWCIINAKNNFFQKSQKCPNRDTKWKLYLKFWFIFVFCDLAFYLTSRAAPSGRYFGQIPENSN